MPTSLVLKLLYIISTSFLAYGSFVKVVQLLKSFRMIYSMTIFRKKINPMRPRVQNPQFSFLCSSWSCMHPHCGYLCFFSSYYPMVIKYSQVALILRNKLVSTLILVQLILTFENLSENITSNRSLTPSTGKADISDKTHCCAQNISAFFQLKMS